MTDERDENDEGQTLDEMEAEGTPETKAVVRAMRMFMFGNMNEAKEQHGGTRLTLDAFTAMTRSDSTRQEELDRAEAATEEDRRVAAGFCNMLSQMVEKLKGVLAEVGAKHHDKHVDVVHLGCGDPNCENCGGQSPLPPDALKGMTQALAKAFGLDPANIKAEVVAAGSLEEALGKMAAKHGGDLPEGMVKLSDEFADPHMQDILDAIEKAGKAPRLPKSRKKVLPS